MAACLLALCATAAVIMVGWFSPTKPAGPDLTSLPHCANEDGSGGPRPCTWNVGPGVDGNGYGRALWVDRTGGIHYLQP